MGEMNVKIDENLLTKLVDRARTHNRSLDEEVSDLLHMAMEKRETLHEAAIRISAMTPKGVRQVDSVEMLREDRNR